GDQDDRESRNDPTATGPGAPPACDRDESRGGLSRERGGAQAPCPVLQARLYPHSGRDGTLDHQPGVDLMSDRTTGPQRETALNSRDGAERDPKLPFTELPRRP